MGHHDCPLYLQTLAGPGLPHRLGNRPAPHAKAGGGGGMAYHNFSHNVVSFCDGLVHNMLQHQANFLKFLISFIIHPYNFIKKKNPSQVSLNVF